MGLVRPVTAGIAAFATLLALLFSADVGPAPAAQPVPARTATSAARLVAVPVAATSPARNAPSPSKSPTKKAKSTPRGVGLVIAVLLVGAAFWLSNWARQRRRRR